MGTRKIKQKSNKRFRTTRSKKQKGGDETQEEKDEKLLKAVMENNFDKVKEALTEGANVNAKDNEDNTALILSSSIGDKDIVELLLKQEGIDVNAMDNDGKTAIQEATLYNHTDIIAMLEKAINNNTENNSSEETQEEKDIKFFDAVIIKITEYTEIQRKRKEEDTIQRTRDEKDQIRRKRDDEDKIRGAEEKKVIDKALDNGANVNYKDDQDDWTVLHTASFHGHKDIMEMLLEKGADVNLVNDKGNTALIIAINEGHLSIVTLLLKNDGVNVNAQNKNGETALIKASLKGHIMILSKLLEKKADVNVQNKIGETALIMASTGGKIEHIEILKMLLDDGADVNMKDKRGSTALIKASEYGHPKIVKILLKKGADVNAKDNDGLTALEIVKKFIVRMNASGNNGMTALSREKNIGRKDVVKLLEKFNKKPEENFIMDSIDKELTYYDEDMMPATTTIKDYLQEDKDNIIFVYKSLKKGVDLDYFATTRDDITEKYNDEHSVFYGCNKIITYFVPKEQDYNKKIVYLGLNQLGLQTSSQYCDIQAFLDNEDHQLFAIKNLNKKYPSFVAKHVLGSNPNVVSASHCQGGDAGSVSTLIKAYSKDFCTISNIEMLQETTAETTLPQQPLTMADLETSTPPPAPPTQGRRGMGRLGGSNRTKKNRKSKRKTKKPKKSKRKTKKH